MNIESKKIVIYPAEKRNGTEEAYLGKLNIEQNIINQRLNLISNESFSVSNNISDEENFSNISLIGNTLTINSGKYIINGYSINLLKPIQVSLNSYFNSSNYWVYFSIKVTDKTILINNINIRESELLGTDNASGLYEGFNFDISENYIPSVSLNNGVTTFNLILGILNYSQESGWTFYDNRILQCKEDASNMTFSTNDSSITNNTNQVILTDWLKDNFILDDGEI